MIAVANTHLYSAYHWNLESDDTPEMWHNDAGTDIYGNPFQCVCGYRAEDHGLFDGSVIVCPNHWVIAENGEFIRMVTDKEFRDTYCPVGEMSDGYHTFNELYHHRAVLLAALCKCHPERTWKSLKHHDGDMYEGMFIVGINTDEGDATYHYDINPYWEMFDCPVLDNAPVWDGHTPEEALRRISTLKMKE